MLPDLHCLSLSGAGRPPRLGMSRAKAWAMPSRAAGVSSARSDRRDDILILHVLQGHGVTDKSGKPR